MSDTLHPTTREHAFSPCRNYRYTLWREFQTEFMFGDGNRMKEGFVQIIGLNPSTADANFDDPTLRRCQDFVKSWGYGEMVMTNLFAFRAKDPKQMMAVTDPVGPENNEWLVRVASQAALVVAAWGTHGVYKERDHYVKLMLQLHHIPLHCIQKTAEGHPSHPLYLKKNLKPIPLLT